MFYQTVLDEYMTPPMFYKSILGKATRPKMLYDAIRPPIFYKPPLMTALEFKFWTRPSWILSTAGCRI